MIFSEEIMRMLFAKALNVTPDTDWEELVRVAESLNAEVARLTKRTFRVVWNDDATGEAVGGCVKDVSNDIAADARRYADVGVRLREFFRGVCLWTLRNEVERLTVETDARPAITREDAAHYAFAYGEDTHGWRGARLRVDAALRTHAKGTP